MTVPSHHAPTFLIVGVPKAGTTSTYFYLRQHPQVFMSPAKEIDFFRFGSVSPRWNGPQKLPLPSFDELPAHGALIDPVNTPGVWWEAIAHSWEEYLRFFAGVTTEPAIGEATPGNFFSDTACARIHKYLPDARLICILRQPVDQGFSRFLNTRRLGIEPLDDFVVAYRECEQRRQAGWGDPHVEYDLRGYYVRYLKRYWQTFGREQLRVYLYDDLQADPVAMMQDIYRFIGVDPSFTPEVSIHYNQAMLPRSQRIGKAMRTQHFLKKMVKKLLPSPVRRKIWGLNRTRPHLPADIRQELTAGHADEIRELEDLLGRDLSGWLDSPA